MENSFKNLIDQAKSILIALPSKPSFDQVAAGLSLYIVLKEDRKDIQIYCPVPMTVEFNRLVSVNKITSEVGNKNLVIKFNSYKATSIDRVSYDIENGEFKLSVIPKDKTRPPRKEQVDISFSGSFCDLGVLIGGANDGDFPIINKELKDSQLVHVGVRDLTLPGGRSVISFANPRSSVSEAAAYLIGEAGYEISSDVATNLLTGIEDGSGNFSDGSVNAETFEIVAGLMRKGGRRKSYFNLQKVNYPPGSIPGQPIPRSMFKKPKISEVDDDQEQTPRDWLEPKIYKGTSTS